MNFTPLYALVLIFFFLSCSTTTPEQYFDRTALVTNKLTHYGAPYFNNLVEMKTSNQLYVYDENGMELTNSYVAHFKSFTLSNLTKDIENIKNLKPTEATKDMIEKSLDLHLYIKDIYSTEYLKILGMMDASASNAAIQDAISQLEGKTLSVLDEKYQKLWDVALPYAEAHGIEVKTY